MSRPSDADLRRYLLRQLPDAEAEALEGAYFADAELATRIEDVEDDLTRAYASGALDAADRAAFERRARTPAGVARVAFIKGVLAERAGTAASGARWTPEAWPRWPALAAAAAILVAIGGWWLTSPDVDDTPPRAVDASAPGSPATPPTVTAPPATAPAPPAMVGLALTVSATRSSGATPSVQIPTGVAAVALRLSVPMPPLADVAAEVRAVDLDRVWRGSAATPSADAPPGTTAEVRVPATELPAGDYVLTLRRGADVLARAFFRVTRPG